MTSGTSFAVEFVLVGAIPALALVAWFGIDLWATMLSLLTRNEVSGCLGFLEPLKSHLGAANLTLASSRY